MFKLRSLSSWAGIFFLFLLLFSFWYFLFRSERTTGSALLPTVACSKNDERKSAPVDDWSLFYYQKGCQAISTETPRIIASWLKEDNLLISETFSLPSLPSGSALLLSPDYTWSTYTSPSSAPALKILANSSSDSRLYLNSALIDLALKETFPLLEKRKSLRIKIAQSLALDLSHNAYSLKKAPLDLTPQEIFDLLDRCQNSACLAPLRPER